jgi:hypothetical protein
MDLDVNIITDSTLNISLRLILYFLRGEHHWNLKIVALRNVVLGVLAPLVSQYRKIGYIIDGSIGEKTNLN